MVTALFLALQPLLGAGWALFPDSYRYAEQAQVVLGQSPAQANVGAADAYCRSRAAMLPYNGSWVPNDHTPAQIDAAAGSCLAAQLAPGHTADPRYESIFTARPGYPMAVAPFIAVFGVASGMRLFGFVVACAGGVLAYTVLRLGGLGTIAAAAGQVIFLVSPLGWWALQATGEGLVTVLILGAVAGILAVRFGRFRLGLGAVAASWIALAVVRYSTLVLVAGALAVACGIMVHTVDRRHPARHQLIFVAAVNVGAVVATMTAIPVLGLPGAFITLQDLLTRHFVGPPVSNPWWQLVVRNYHFWPSWLVTPSVSLAMLLCSVIGTIAMYRWRRDLMWIAVGLAAAGFAQIAAHPLMSEAPRLGLLMWMPAVIGGGVLVHAAAHRIKRRTMPLAVPPDSRAQPQ